MYTLIKSVLRGIKKRLFQYVGISVLLIIVVATMTGLYGNSDRIQNAFHVVEKESGMYDYRLKNESIDSYKNPEQALKTIKEIIKKQFDDEKTLEKIDKISLSNIQGDTLPDDLNDNLKTYLLNWSAKYKLILINHLLNTSFNNVENSVYQIQSSFLKSITFNDKSRKLVFNFEDAFYNDDKNQGFSPKRNGINEVYITQGKKALNKNEVVINATFGQINNINLNSEFEFLEKQEKLKVVGFGYAYWGIIPPVSVDNIDASPNNTTAVFVTRQWMNEYLEKNSADLTKVSTPLFLKIKNNDIFAQNSIENVLGKVFNFNYGSLVIKDNEDFRSGSFRQSFDMQNIVYSSISLIVMLAATFIVLSYVKKEIELQKKQMGVIKALGYTNFEITIGFTVLFFLLSIFSTGFGFALGLPLQIIFNKLGDPGFFLPLSTYYFSLISFIIGVIVSTIIFTLASFIQSYQTLSSNPLFLIQDHETPTSSKWLAILKKPFSYWSFKPRLAMSFALKSIPKLIIIGFIFVFATFLLMFENVAIDIFDYKIGNFYGSISKDVYYYNETENMFKFNDKGKIESNIFEWIKEKDLDITKAIKSETFSIDSQEKYDNLMKLKKVTDFKGYYITSSEINLLYKNIGGAKQSDAIKYIKQDKEYIGSLEAMTVYQIIKTFFSYFTKYTAVIPNFQKLPGIVLGYNVLNNQEYYPNLELKVSVPAKWIDHQENDAIKNAMVFGLYNNLENSLIWKNWFNMKEEKKRDVDPILNNSHRLIKQKVSYINKSGQSVEEEVFVVPTIVSKNNSMINNLTVGSKVLMTVNVQGIFTSVIFDIRGITISNLDTSVYYVNIDDLRKVINFVDENNKPLQNTFNNFYSKNWDSIFPLNSINIFQFDNDYSINALKNRNVKLINKYPVIMPLIKDRISKMFNSIRFIILITKWLTIIALAFVLIIIINMILDNNILIIAMMKAMGYRINEINILIIGSYIFSLILAFILGTLLSYVAWHFILAVVVNLTSTIFLLAVNALTIVVSFILIFVVITIGYGVGLFFIKFKSVSSLLQSG